MSSAKSKNVSLRPLGKLDANEQTLLRFVLQHGLITKPCWESARLFPDSDPAAMSHAMWSLTRRQLLVAQPLHAGRMYFQLSTTTAERLGLPPIKGKPLCESSKLRAYARLLFFTQCDLHAIRLDPLEQAKRVGEPMHGTPACFYGRVIAPEFLGYLRIDTLVHTDPARSARVLRGDVMRLVRFAAIRERIKLKRFELTWITPTQRRADAVIRHFQSYERIAKAPLRPLVIPELVPLACPLEVAQAITRIPTFLEPRSKKPNRSPPKS